MTKKLEISPWNKIAVKPSEAAAMLSMGEKAIKTLMKIGILPFMKIGIECKIYVKSLEELQETLKYKELCLKTKTLIDIDYRDVAI